MKLALRVAALALFAATPLAAQHGGVRANPGRSVTYQDSVCAAVTRLLASARVNFADIIDRPINSNSSDGRFHPKVAFPRMRSTVVPRSRYFTSAASTRIPGEAEAAGRRLNHAVSQCIPGWSATESDSRSDSRSGSHYFEYRDPASGIEIRVRYQSRYDSRFPNMWMWGFSMEAPEPRR
jgi:hypothetical protein